MKAIPCFAATLLWTFVHAQEPNIVISERPEWQKPVIEKVTFGAEAKSIEQILGKAVERPDSFWSGFVVFSCTAKENLGKRLMWISAEVEFSNGYKREFKNISFYILSKGTEYDIAKIPFDSAEPVSVRSVHITSVAIK